MFQHLIASVHPHARAGNPAIHLLSAAAHLSALLLLVRATTQSPDEVFRAAERFTDIFLEAGPALSATPAPPVAAREEARAEAVSQPDPIGAPDDVPVDIPPISATLATLPAAALAAPAASPKAGTGIAGEAATTLVLDSVEIAESLAPFAFEVTERVRLPRLRNRDFILELLHRRFPPRIANRQRTSEARVRFMIDARGKVIPTSIKLIATNQAEFAVATLAVTERLRFHPARHGREAVPILIEMPFRWRSAR